MVVVTVFIACRPAPPSRDGPVWVEVKISHFRLWTDGSIASGRELVQEMEHDWQAVTRAMHEHCRGRLTL
jgi:hypothetical protein